MWRQESGFCEMFLAYYNCHFMDAVTPQTSYRDFLFEILSRHEESFA